MFNVGVNFHGLAVALIGVVLILPVIGLVLFEVISQETSILLGSWCFVLASLIGKKLKLKGKIFWVFPFGFISLMLALLITYKYFKYFKFVLLILVFIVVVIVFYNYYRYKKQLNSLGRYQIKLPPMNELKLWRRVEYLFCIPPFYSKWTPKICTHNLKVLELLESEGIYLEHSEAFKEELGNTKQKLINRKKASPNYDIQEAFLKNIQLKHQQRKENLRKR